MPPPTPRFSKARSRRTPSASFGKPTFPTAACLARDSRLSSIPGLFKKRPFEPDVILLAVGRYLRFSRSYQNVKELLAERGIAYPYAMQGDARGDDEPALTTRHVVVRGERFEQVGMIPRAGRRDRQA